jgi:ABC-type nitrate/sulfonate/bicarbonate transport system permease component
MDAYRLPSPLQVAADFVPIIVQSREIAAQEAHGNGGIAIPMATSVITLLLGLILGVVSGLAVGLLMTYSRRIGWILDLPTRLLRAVPPFGLIPFVLIWIGTTQVGGVLVIWLYVSLLVMTNTINACGNLPMAQSQFARTLGAAKTQVYKDVILPAILPELVGPIRVALAFSWGLLVVAELVGGQVGLGRVLSELVPALATDQVITVTLWIVLLGLVFDLLYMRLQQRLLYWHHAAR